MRVIKCEKSITSSFTSFYNFLFWTPDFIFKISTSVYINKDIFLILFLFNDSFLNTISGRTFGTLVFGY